ncbi:unnamed protein product [Rhizophagus irregularis]|uniref:Uncharacterized protein n=2 Tax=Rhizophagus irregularis TaxID=588596 RepID=A0A916DW27_9GLOM|nr:unnamed protein product [Rhizophagus irregularis]CAB5290206.1 unnamed protein product [Rhizophagus irregularis]
MLLSKILAVILILSSLASMLNCLHNLAKGNLKPVQDIVRAVGKLKCSQEKIFYVPILAGTIQGPLEDMVKESLYDLTRLLLRLLSDSEMGTISSHMIKFKIN